VVSVLASRGGEQQECGFHAGALSSKASNDRTKRACILDLERDDDLGRLKRPGVSKEYRYINIVT
jgi:hypothetical protein